jgi:hypothetical protein
MLTMLEAAFETLMRPEFWAKLPGGWLLVPLVGDKCGGRGATGTAGGIIWSTRMLGLLRVMAGTRAGREGGVLGEWVVAPGGQCTGVPYSSPSGRGGGYTLESLDTAIARRYTTTFDVVSELRMN